MNVQPLRFFLCLLALSWGCTRVPPPDSPLDEDSSQDASTVVRFTSDVAQSTTSDSVSDGSDADVQLADGDVGDVVADEIVSPDVIEAAPGDGEPVETDIASGQADVDVVIDLDGATNDAESDSGDISPDMGVSEPEPCVKDCEGRICGDDGCGGVCGYCTYPEVCDASGQCVQICIPDCTDKVCGNDGCGGLCAPGCEEPLMCADDGKCYNDTCVPNCLAKACGNDGCGGSCGQCEEPQVCTFGLWECHIGPCGNLTSVGECQGDVAVWCEEGEQIVEYDCSGVDDHECLYNPVVNKYHCMPVVDCEPKCDGKSCGSDSCGGWCTPGCPTGWSCALGECMPVAGGSCGSITSVGQCVGDVLWFCATSTLYALDCESTNEICKWSQDELTFSCVPGSGGSTLTDAGQGSSGDGSNTSGNTMDDGGDVGPGEADALPPPPDIEITDTGCVIDCAGKTCGSNGCGGLCGYGYCPYPEICAPEGICEAVCVPQCEDKFCGPDACGSVCGSCEGALLCGDDGLCYEPDCEPQCVEGQKCGDDGCGGDCGFCGLGLVCQEGNCVASPCGDVPVDGKCVDGNKVQWCIDGVTIKEEDCNDYADHACGYDGFFNLFKCMLTDGCETQCTEGQECGDDGCGGICPPGCASGWTCEGLGCLPHEGASCGPIFAIGECQDDILWFCLGGVLNSIDCSILGDDCGWAGTKFDCM